MKPPPFEYLRPRTVEEALAMLASEEGAKPLAGGQSLLPALNMRLLRPRALVDLNRVADLDGGVELRDGTLVVGALARQADPRLRRHPLLAEALPYVGHVVTRNRGTVGGSLAHADAAAELSLCLVLLGGTVRARSAQGEREIAAADLFLGPYSTALAPDELVLESEWPYEEGAGYAFEELAPRHGDYAFAAAAAAVREGEVRVAVGGPVPRPTLLEVDPEDPGGSAAAQVEPWPTVHASAAYLRHLVRVLVERAVARARERAAA